MAGPVAVADTSVLIALDQLDLLHTLSLFYQTVLVPASVRSEFLKKEEKLRREARASLTMLISEPPFAVCDDYDTVQVELLCDIVHRGEAEAISQFSMRNADQLLVDEKRARMRKALKEAERYGTGRAEPTDER